MGICASSPAPSRQIVVDDAAAARSKEIDRQIKSDEQRQHRIIKLLLLGAGESGKSTVLKSMRLIHNISFTEAEVEMYRRIVFHNMVDGMRQILQAIDDASASLQHPEYVQYGPLFVCIPEVCEKEPYPGVYEEPLKYLWADATVQAFQKRGNEYALPDNLSYLFSEIDRIWAPSYRPTEADILRCRLKTSGVIETRFTLSDRTFAIFDVGGQRSERRKWVSCFENVTAVLFIVALNGYDACMVEDRRLNQMKEALMLFKSICNSKWFVRTSMILFLNKADLFAAKIADRTASMTIQDIWQEFDGDPHDPPQAKLFFKNEFMKLNQHATKEVYANFTTAVDPKLLGIVMASVTDIILTRSLRDTLL